MVHTYLKKSLPVLFAGLLISACDPWDRGAVNPNTAPPDQIEGWAPIYDSAGTTREIKAVAARNIERGGKIYIKDHTLYQVENGKGIHVMDISRPASPVKKGFIQVSGCQEMSIIGTTLYTNNLNDLVAVDIADPARPVLTDRITNAFHLFSPTAPPSAGWYECINTSKGNVVGWELKTLDHPKCR